MSLAGCEVPDGGALIALAFVHQRETLVAGHW